ncbi:hypothetical protein AB1Y20_013050 [Prymnesium parvum]|uniref:XRRM domain-containing protein n=1 Tax=Prymnesium parvum TaxID=97485 RepID=A0AB34IKJ8_PRYPA
MSIYSGIGVAASIRQARQKQAVEEDERTELPLREQQLLASVRKEAGGLAAPRRVKPRPIDWRAAELPEETPPPPRAAAAAPPGWSKGSWLADARDKPARGGGSRGEGGKVYLSKAEWRKARKAAAAPRLQPAAGLVVDGGADEFSSGGVRREAKRSAAAPSESRGKKRRRKGGGGGEEGEGEEGRRGEREGAAEELAKFAQAAADEAAAPREEVDFARGTVLLLKQRADVKTAEGRFPRGHVASLKQQLGVGGTVSFVEIVPDTLTAYVRFDTAEAARKALSVRGLGELSLLRGEAERQYWMRAAKIEAEQETARNAALARKKGAIKAGGKPKNAEKAPTGKPQSKGFAFRKGTVSF